MKVKELTEGMLVIPHHNWRVIKETKVGSCFIKIVPDIIATTMFDNSLDVLKPMIYMGAGKLKKPDRFWSVKKYYEFFHPDCGVFRVSGHDMRKIIPLFDPPA